MTVSPLLVVADAGGADPDPRVAIGKALVHCAVFLIFGFSRKKSRQNPKICEIARTVDVRKPNVPLGKPNTNVFGLNLLGSVCSV